METCRWCGGPISAEEAICPHCGVRLRRESTRCRQCREEIRDGLAVCPHCGEDLGKRRIRWKLIGSLGGVVLVGILVYVLLFVVPLPANLPFLVAQPSPTPTEVILPPTETPTETPRPPTATPTRTPTFTPVITATATLTSGTTATPAESANPTATPTAAPTETPAVKYGAPQLTSPADGEQFRGSGARIQLDWEPVGILADDEWYSVSLSYVDRNGDVVREVVAWAKNEDIPLPVGEELYDVLGGDRVVTWAIRVVSGVPGAGTEAPVSPPSEGWTFRWG
jgi:hypothetical protein